MRKNLIDRIRAGLRLFLVLGLAAATMAGCVSTEAESGIFLIRIADAAVEQIAETAGIPVWSPSDDSLAWGNEDGLFVKTLHEPAPKHLASGPVSGVPAWSPNGDRLAYIDGNRASLVVVDAISGNEHFAEPLDRREISGAQFALLNLGGPSWAPDGSRLAYVCRDGAGDEICVIQSDGTRSRQVTRLKPRVTVGGSVTPQASPAESNTGPPAWSPRGNLLAAAIYPEQPGAPTGIFLIDPDGGVARRVSSLQPNSVISWFPDGRSILFSTFRLTRGRSDVIRIVLATRGIQSLTDGLPEGSRNPALSPDASQIAVETAGGVAVLGVNQPVQTFSVPGLRSTYPAWGTDDGTSIAVSAVPDPI